MSYDLYYVKNFSILFDLLIILQTLRVVLCLAGLAEPRWGTDSRCWNA